MENIEFLDFIVEMVLETSLFSEQSYEEDICDKRGVRAETRKGSARGGVLVRERDQSIFLVFGVGTDHDCQPSLSGTTIQTTGNDPIRRTYPHCAPCKGACVSCSAASFE